METVKWDRGDHIKTWILKFSDYSDVIMGAMASQITSLAIVYWTVYSSADQRKHQSSASLAFGRGIHWSPVNSPHKWPVTRKMFPFDDVIMGLYKIMFSLPIMKPSDHIDGSVQDCSISSALALEILQFCPKPSTYFNSRLVHVSLQHRHHI